MLVLPGKKSASRLAAGAAALVAGTLSADVSRADNPQNWQLVWSDEFDKPGAIDSTKWSWETGGHGWGNNESQFYTDNRPENCRVELFPDGKNSRLIIEAHKEQFEGKNYTSARLKSVENWTYGRLEVRAKLPNGRGLWPAVWMLPTERSYGRGGWPDNGEIDVMEQVGYEPNTIHATVHTKSFNHNIGTQVGKQTIVPTATDDFNDYVLEWRPHQISVFVNGLRYFTFDRQGRDWQAFPFDKPFRLLLNIAVGGNWGGKNGIDDTIFPQRMEIDYVRFYKMISAPYGSSPISLPGRIEAEQFDNGGEGFAFHDSGSDILQSPSEEQSAAHKFDSQDLDSVDSETDADDDSGQHIARMNTDDWLSYSVDVTKNAEYGFTFRVASPHSDKAFYLEVDDKRATPDIRVPNTGGWGQWQSISPNKISLTKGAHKIRLVSKTDGYSLNWMDVWDAGA